MAEIVTLTRRPSTRASLIPLLAAGRSVRQAARDCGISERTVFRYLKQEGFVQEIEQTRQNMKDQIEGRLVTAGLAAVEVAAKIMLESKSDPIRLRAAIALLRERSRIPPAAISGIGTSPTAATLVDDARPTQSVDVRRETIADDPMGIGPIWRQLSPDQQTEAMDSIASYAYGVVFELKTGRPAPWLLDDQDTPAATATDDRPCEAAKEDVDGLLNRRDA